MSTFIALKSAGMGNRFKVYVSYMARYATIKIEKSTDFQLFENFELCNREEDIKIYPHTGSGWRLLVDDDEVKYIDKYKTIDQLYNDTPQYFVDKYLPIFQSLRIRPNIQKIIDSFTAEWDKENMIGLHIRTSLPPVDSGRNMPWIDFEGFEKEILKYPSTQKFFLASDNNEVSNHYMSKYPEQIITYPKKDIVRNDAHFDDLDQTIDGFVEMYLLSQCFKKLIVTFSSTYSECAWWFGGCKAEVVMPTFWDKVPKEFFDSVYNPKDACYTLSGVPVAAEGCRTYAPTNVGDNYTIKNWKVIYE